MLREKEDRLGTLAIAVPKPKDLLGPVTSSVLVGDKNAVSARMFAEYVAAKKGKIALVSVYLERLDEMQAPDVFNDASEAYKGVIPQDRWRDPYMSAEELRNEIEDGVEFYGWIENNVLV